MKRIVSLSCLLLLAGTVFAAVVPVLSGHFSLQGGVPKTEGHLRATAINGDPLHEHLDIWMTGLSSPKPIRNYSVEMTKRLHVVIVSADLSTFLHVHPQLGADGHFAIDQQFPAPGIYHLYADGEPANLDHQVFRFDIAVGKVPQTKPLALASTGREIHVGPYTVDLSRVTLSANGMDMLDVHILKDGKPANDLHPYLGAAAHAVFLNSQDLTYVHVHPMAMGAAHMGGMEGMEGMDMSGSDQNDTASSSPDMMLHVAIKEPGTYKLWLQFHGGSQLYVAPFVLTAQ